MIVPAVSMKQLVKDFFFSVAPVWATSFFSARVRAHSHRTVKSCGCARINESLFARFGNRVLSGPFEGLVLSASTKSEQIGPYLLGVYESELVPAWGVILRGHFDQIIDIGAKFGYYAFGLARRLPASRVVAFDTDRWAREVMRLMARDNGVSNVEIRAYCSPEWLDENLAEGALVLSDCEGFEGKLFCSIPISNLPSATLIIETHECLTRGVLECVRERLGGSHFITEIASCSHCRESPVDLGFFDERERSLALQEVRPQQVWLLGVPKVGPNLALQRWLPLRENHLQATDR
jgi:hypothetical protein